MSCRLPIATKGVGSKAASFANSRSAQRLCDVISPTYKAMFQRIEISGWRQMREVDITFHERLTILTGANGSGKTTILNILGQHFGWNLFIIPTPRFSRTGPGLLEYGLDVAETRRFKSRPEEQREQIGQLTYSNGEITEIAAPVNKQSSSYRLQLLRQQGQRGLTIPSHRPLYNYQQVESIPTRPRTRDEMHSSYAQLIRTRFENQHTPRGPSYLIKETLITLATFGYGNAAVSANPLYRNLFEQFQDILAIVLPPKIGFKQLAIRVPEVVLETHSGEFSLDAVSRSEERRVGK